MTEGRRLPHATPTRPAPRPVPGTRERPRTCSLCDDPPAAKFEFRVQQRSVIVWICDTPHRADSLGELLGISADEAQIIALEIAVHLTYGRPRRRVA
jgi:hypothetical protein